MKKKGGSDGGERKRFNKNVVHKNERRKRIFLFLFLFCVLCVDLFLGEHILFSEENIVQSL
jgi:hypothetical protein